MGKKDAKKKKGLGAEKTAVKTEKKLSSKLKKELEALGEDDIEKTVQKLEAEGKKNSVVSFEPVPQPSPRANFTLTPHPDKDELYLFGGEYYNGKTTVVYNDLFNYSIKNNTWSQVKASGSPPPRSGHQAAAVSIAGGQLWIFGGEFTSELETQFHHYKDLWMFHVASSSWEKVSSPNGPSPRSGHRMVAIKRSLVVFGGFFDNGRECKYFNDLFIFCLDSRQWRKIETVGHGPCPRSACLLAPLSDGRIYLYGGYSKEKVKRDVEKGIVHADSFLLCPDKRDTSMLKWKWNQVKPIGLSPFPPRSGLSLACAGTNRAFVFGGVWDEDDGDEMIEGHFSDELLVVNLEKSSWNKVVLTGKRDRSAKKRRRKQSEAEESKMEMDGEVETDSDEDAGEQSEQEGDDEKIGKKLEDLSVVASTTTKTQDDVFTVTQYVAQPTSGDSCNTDSNSTATKTTGPSQPLLNIPPPRMNAGTACKSGILFLYGGIVEKNDRQIMLSDFYSLDVKQLDNWKTLISLPPAQEMDWQSSSDDESDEEDDSSSDDEDGSSEEENDESDSRMSIGDQS